VWRREIDGLRLTFHLAGINNQNFVMRDEETGTYWQQISGAAIAGPLKGGQLALVHSDELTLATWKSEEPRGTVLNFPGYDLAARDLMLGIQAFGASRAFLYDRVIKEKLVKDHVGAEPVLLVVGADDQSVRAFRDRIPGMEGAADFYRITGKPSGALLLDAATGSEWNFQGCAISGKAKGLCLEPVPMLKDYWFDWRNYNPKTTVYGKSN